MQPAATGTNAIATSQPTWLAAIAPIHRMRPTPKIRFAGMKLARL
jgi:hypothetical protein